MSEDKDSIHTENQSGGINIAGDARIENSELVGRDKIVVGAGATNVAINSRYVWQNNVRIGKLVIPARLVLLLVAFALVAAVALWYVYVPAAFQPGQTGILIAEFGQQDSQGNLHGSDDGKRLSEWMYRQLEQELSNLPNASSLIIWQDSMSPLQKRTLIGVIPDEATAKQIAASTHAHIVIYGILKANQNPATFVPSFYVPDIQGEADEIVGSQALGAPFPLQLPLDFGDPRVGTYMTTNLRPRADALVWFAAGLAQDLTGDYPGAYQTFKEAEQHLTGLDAQQGKQVLYYFIGRVALSVAWNDNTPHVFNSTQAALDEAEKAFKTSLQADPTYARAAFGLGQVYFQRAQRMALAGAVTPDQIQPLLNQAIQQQQQALQLAPQSAGSQVELKARAALASCYFLLGQVALSANDPAQAEKDFKQALDPLTQVIGQAGPNEYRFLATLYQIRGTVYYELGHARLVQGDKADARAQFQSAIADYANCTRQADQFLYDAIIQDLSNKNCKPNVATVKQALEGIQ
ncbi:MAG: hypothetical protein WCF84_09380 [Anaerolineae bacterium]